jgi:hypothetical protein
VRARASRFRIPSRARTPSGHAQVMKTHWPALW